MTRNNALLVFGLFILIVNLSMGKDGLLSHLADRYRNHAVAVGAAPQAPAAEPVAIASNAAPVAPVPEVFVPEPEPVPAEMLPERLAPRVEVLLVEPADQ